MRILDTASAFIAYNVKVGFKMVCLQPNMHKYTFIMTVDQAFFFFMTSALSETIKNIFCRKVGKPLRLPGKVLCHQASISANSSREEEWEAKIILHLQFFKDDGIDPVLLYQIFSSLKFLRSFFWQIEMFTLM